MRGHRSYLDIEGPLPKGKFYVPKPQPNVARDAVTRGPILPMPQQRRGIISRVLGGWNG